MGNRIALGIEPLEVEQWLRTLKKEGELANPTLDKTRRVMSLVYKHGQRYGLIPRNQESNPMRFDQQPLPDGSREICNAFLHVRDSLAKRRYTGDNNDRAY